MDQSSPAPVAPLLSEPDPHTDVNAGYRFPNVTFRGAEWSFGHLEPFAFREEIEPGLVVDVVVLFTSHCFTHSRRKDTRTQVPVEEIYWDGQEERVLNEQRYLLSKRYLRGLEALLRAQHARALGGAQSNYATFTAMDKAGRPVHYAIFFEVNKDRKRKKRLLLRVQSAYVLDELTNRQKDARKVRLAILLRRAYSGEKVVR